MVSKGGVGFSSFDVVCNIPKDCVWNVGAGEFLYECVDVDCVESFAHVKCYCYGASRWLVLVETSCYCVVYVVESCVCRVEWLVSVLCGDIWNVVCDVGQDYLFQRLCYY